VGFPVTSDAGRPGSRSAGRGPVTIGLLAVVVVAGCVAAGCRVEPSPAGPGSGGSDPTGALDGGDGSGGGGGDGPDRAARSIAPGTGRSARLLRLADGDSGWFEIDGREVEIRLLGYNAPERLEGDGGPPSCNGEAARAALVGLLDGAATVEAVGDERDRFDRVLVDLAVDGTSAVDRLVATGRGLAIGDDDPYRRDLMREAAALRLGLWGDACGRPAAAGIEVAAVEADPPGRDEDDLNGEWVELVNRGPGPVDLAGWDIRDDSSSHRFDLDGAGTIEPGDTLVVRTGAGRPAPGELFLGSSTPVWSNRADSVLVIDPAGVVAAWAFVG
jgi:endonuclease YncB( thermonuclease family)